MKRSAKIRVVAKTKAKKGAMSFTTSINILRRTRVLLKVEKMKKAFTLWHRQSNVRTTALVL